MRVRHLLPLLLPLLVVSCSDDAASGSSAATTAPDAGPEPSPNTTSGPEPAGVEVAWEVSLPPGSYGAPVCDGAACVFPFTSAGKVFSGDLVGTGIGAGGGASHADGGLSGGEYSIFIGEVAGCGRGSFAYVDQARGSDPSQLDGTWTIVEGSGTDDLAGITGSGTSVTTAEATPDGGAPAGSATASGTVICG